MRDPDPSNPPGPPRAPTWAKIAGIVAAVIVVLVIIMLVVGGEHSPRRHFGGEPSVAEHTPPPGTTHGEQP